MTTGAITKLFSCMCCLQVTVTTDAITKPLNCMCCLQMMGDHWRDHQAVKLYVLSVDDK